MHWLACPHSFTVLAAVILLHLLEAERPRLWMFGALFAVWTNPHGGFLFGLMLSLPMGWEPSQRRGSRAIRFGGLELFVFSERARLPLSRAA